MNTPYGAGRIVEEYYSKPVQKDFPPMDDEAPFPKNTVFYEVVKSSVIRLDQSAIVGYKERLQRVKTELENVDAPEFIAKASVGIAEAGDILKDIEDFVEGDKTVPTKDQGVVTGRKFDERKLIK